MSARVEIHKVILMSIHSRVIRALLYDFSYFRSIGVSNFDVDNLKQVLKIARIKPAVNQVCLYDQICYHLFSQATLFLVVSDILPSLQLEK